MQGISGPTVCADLRAVAANLQHPLVRVVAGLAQRLQLAGDEAIPVAAMGLDVIHDARRNDQTT